MPRDQRAAAVAGEPTGTAADGYLEKVCRESHRLTEEDIEGLRRAGFGDDAIFELTIAAAYGEATRRFDRALAALDDDLSTRRRGSG